MKISLFVEHPVPRPWTRESERQAFTDSLEQLARADDLGFYAVWLTEHHFLEEYCHSSAPEVFLGALSQRTTRLRLGHGIMHLPPGINHPARVAERVSALDCISGGRVEFGTGEASSVAELDGFGVDPGRKRADWEEGLRVAVRCMTEVPFTGHEGPAISMPPRNVIPKPYQQPHPPIWVACTRPATVTLAAERGIGALSFSFRGPEDFEPSVRDYYNAFADRAVPIGLAPNANILCSSGDLMVSATDEKAHQTIAHAEGFFGFGIGHYYVTGDHRPGKTELWKMFVDHKRSQSEATESDLSATGDRQDWEKLAKATAASRSSLGVGSPERLRDLLRRYEATGVDQVMFLLPPLQHEVIMESLELFGTKVLPEFIDRDESAEEAKRRRLEPMMDAVMARRPTDGVPLDPNYSFGGVPVSWDGSYRASEASDSMKGR